MHELRYVVDAAMDGRLLRAAAMEGLRMSYGQFKSAKFHGEVLLDGERAFANTRVRAGQVLLVRVPESENTQPAPCALALCVAYEDDDLLAVVKPAPLASASSAHQGGVTLENVVYTYLRCPDGFVYRPVNRLDKGTSGLMLVAKNAHIQQLLQQSLHSDAFVREYLAVVEGAPKAPEGVIDLPIGKAEGATIRREVRENGKPARTRYRVLQTGNGRSLVRLRLDTGRTHQIRVHMRAAGCPVAGDFLYGAELAELSGRFALHSAYLRLRHPITGRELELQSPLPPELDALLGANRTNCEKD